MTLSRMTLMIGMMLVIAACSRGDRDVVLTRLDKPNDGPDEFLIAPGNPLQAPPNFSDLPLPAPGQGNLTDHDPRADGIIALGGDPNAGRGIAPADAGLVNHTTRFGTDPTVRETLREEDIETRRKFGRVNIFRFGTRDNYDAAYKKQWLDPLAEQQRLRRSGVATPTAPPPSE